MLAHIFIVIFTFLFLMTPILAWLYLYENFSQEFVKRRHIIFWMFLWSLITLPIILSSQTSLVFVYENIFSHLYLRNIFHLILWIVWWIIMMYLVFFLILSLYKKSLWWLRFMLYCWVMVSVISILIIVSYGIITMIPVLHNILLPETRLIFGIVFSSLTGMLWYYLIVSLLEESWKFMWHLSQAHKDHYTVSLSHFTIFSVSIAVWFSFFENALYVYMFYAREWIVSQLVSMSFFRWTVSLSLHIFCALLFSLGMWYFWNISQQKWLRYFFLSWYIFFIFASIIFHTLFNLSLTFGYISGVFLVFLGLYFAVAYILPLSQQKNAL